MAELIFLIDEYSFWVSSKNRLTGETATKRLRQKINSLKQRITVYTLFMFHLLFVVLSVFRRYSRIVYNGLYTCFCGKQHEIFILFTIMYLLFGYTIQHEILVVLPILSWLPSMQFWILYQFSFSLWNDLFIRVARLLTHPVLYSPYIFLSVAIDWKQATFGSLFWDTTMSRNFFCKFWGKIRNYHLKKW